MKIKEISLFKNDKYELVHRKADDNEAKDRGYKPHTILFIREDENQARLNILYNGANDFVIPQAEFIKWAFLPKYLVEEIKDSYDIYVESMEELR